MKIYFLLTAIIVLLLGCRSGSYVELIEIRDAPIILEIRTTVLRVSPNDQEGNYQVHAVVLNPEEYSGKELELLVSGIPKYSNFLRIDEVWTINFDVFSFKAIESVGISAWDYRDLNPRKRVEPVAGGDATR